MNDVNFSTFCPIAFGGYDSKAQSVCCNVKLDKELTSFSEIINSSRIKKIQQNLLAGTKDSACSVCWFSEKHNLNSSLRLSLPRRTKEQAQYEITTPRIRRLVLDCGNVCNLACRTCGPWDSSSWWKEYSGKKLDQLRIYNQSWHRGIQVDKLCLEDYSELEQIIVYGGEPFLNLEHIEVLNKIIKDGNSQNCTLSYTSNMTVKIPEKLIMAAENFKSWDVIMSIDGVTDRFNYIRTLGKWNLILDNINNLYNYSTKNQKFFLRINTVVSALNILYLHEIEKFSDEINCEMTYQFCENPKYYNASIFTEGEKYKIINILETKNIRSWASIVDYLQSYEFDKDNRNKFFEEIQFTKYYHDLDAYQYFPELMDLLWQGL